MYSVLSLFSTFLVAHVSASPFGPPGRPQNPGPPGPPGPPQGPPTGPPSGPPSSPGPDFSSTPQSPEYTSLFEYPLPIAPIAEPFYTENVNGQRIQFFEVTIEAFDQQVYPNLGPAHLVGYNGSSPGPTFKMEKGVEAIVRFLNRGSDPAAVHLHGSPSHAPWDGWATDYVQPGQYKDYYYPNNQAGPLWYHDHSDGITTQTVYYGQAGHYLIHDPAEDANGLPEGDYDIPISIMDKAYQSNGDLVSPEGEVINFYGDIIHMNGQPWPYLEVEPRKYRFRFYDISLSRPYDIQFVDESGSAIEVQVIASDAGLFEYPVSTTDVLISMAERYEIVIDFAAYKGSNVSLNNILHYDFVPEFANTDKLMRFVVGDTITSNRNNGPVPSTLKQVNWPPQKDAIDHVFNFQHGGDDIWTINGEAFDDINNRILARPQQGTVENWIVNYASGPGVHPVHVHLVNMQIVSRTGGTRGVLPYEAAGLKDTVLLDPGESIQVRAVYGPWNGLYTFHCHNLVHEDHMMMDAFNVTLLEELGYRFEDTQTLADPMDARFAARDYSAAAYRPAAIRRAITSLGNLNAYKAAPSLASAEAAYYSTAGFPVASAAATATATGAPFQPTGGPPAGGPPVGGFGGPHPPRAAIPAPTQVWRA